MALPSTVTSSGSLNFVQTLPLNLLDPCIFEKDDKIYLFYAKQRASSEITIYRSSDGGETWTALDTIDDPFPQGSNLITCRRDGDVVYGIWAEDSFYFFIRGFSLATEQWLSDLAIGGDIAGPVGGTDWVTLGLFPRYWSAIFRTDRTVVFAFPGIRENISSVNYNRVAYKIWGGGDPETDWGATIQVASGSPIHHTLVGMLKGSDDRTHLFVAETTVATSTILRHIAIEADGTLGSMATITSSIEIILSTFPGGNPFGQACSWWDGSVQKIATIFSNGSSQVSVAFADSAASPTWTVEVVDTTLPPNVGILEGTAMALVVFGTDIYALWITGDSPASQKLYYSKRLGASSWNTPTLLRDRTGETPNELQHLSAAAISAGIAVTYSDDNNLLTEYDLIPLSSGTPTEGALYGIV